MRNKDGQLKNFLGQLNPEQLAAVTAPDGPVLVLAGAGSGKTRVLTGRAFYLIAAKSVSPGSIVVVTFTNKAAEELRSRLRSYVGSDELPWAGTFHAFCARLLRQHGTALGISREFSIYDTSDTEQLLSGILADRRIGRDALSPSLLRSWISLVKNGGRLTGRHPHHTSVPDLLKEYDERLRAARAVDFDDLLGLPLALFEKDSSVLELLQRKFDYVLIDEFQDTNRHQYELAMQLARPQNNLFVVGDDDQSIYGWRGANYRNVFDFQRDLKEAKVYSLERNYRSTQPILDVANDVIAARKHSESKRLWTAVEGGERVTIRQCAHAAEEAYEVVGEIEQLVRRHGYSYRDLAILFRTNALSRSFEETLVTRAIPYSLVGGTRFYDRKEIKDFLAYLRVLVNPEDDQACRRVLRTPPRGIGAVTVGHLEEAARLRGCGMASVLLDPLQADELPMAARRRLEPITKVLCTLRESTVGLDLVSTVETVLQCSGLVEYFTEQEEEQSEERVANLEQLVAAARDRSDADPGCTLVDFLNDVALVADIDDYDETPDRVVLMTMHAAKGLEFPVVLVVALEDGIVPHQRSQGSDDEIEEERRLLYVAITRAQERLVLSYAQNRYVNGVVGFQDPSPFLRDISPDHLRGWSLPGGRSLNTNDSGPDSHGQSESAPRWGQTSAPSALSSPIPFRIGDVVEHPEFGIGVVTAKAGGISDLKVRVAFEGMGSKLLAVKFAPLRKVT
ncbi:UvrD-helicase domain-containing protein [bacterium]|nr:UvrD-helicase domain-containing protein [bacterium]MBU1985145.1 UvrD-helicase domain-containing protein [bacterium]